VSPRHAVLRALNATKGQLRGAPGGASPAARHAAAAAATASLSSQRFSDSDAPELGLQRR
jgi:hypothetical protein